MRWTCRPILSLSWVWVSLRNQRAALLKGCKLHQHGQLVNQGIPAYGIYREHRDGHLTLFQIEHNGSWHWEISDQSAHMYLALSGPNEQQSHWFKTLKTGDRFTTVPAAVGVSHGFDSSMAELTRYRRMIRRKTRITRALPSSSTTI